MRNDKVNAVVESIMETVGAAVAGETEEMARVKHLTRSALKQQKKMKMPKQPVYRVRQYKTPMIATKPTWIDNSKKEATAEASAKNDHTFEDQPEKETLRNAIVNMKNTLKTRKQRDTKKSKK